MFKNINTKAIALGGISLCAAGAIAIGVEVTRAVTFEIQKARAATTTALAEIEKSKAEKESAIAEREKAVAAKIAAENLLLAAKETRDATMLAAKYMAQGQRDAAEKNAEGLIDATKIDRYVDNQVYDGFTSHFVEPAKAIDKFNKQIAQLKREAETGIDRRTRRLLNDAERADRLAQIRILEEEKQIESDTSAATMSDLFNVVMKGASGIAGGMGALYPSGNSAVPSNRRFRIHEEK